MECYRHCQSCGMPLDHQELFGTETNGQKSTSYCIYCYRNGAFTQPHMTVEEMEKNVRRRLIESKAQPVVIEKAVNNVHYLARWLAMPVNHDING